jgi:hypothetical protein
MSSASIRSSSELVSDDSEQSILTLPIELDTVVRSPGGLEDQCDGNSDEKYPLLFLPGIFIALPVIVGDESGDGCSASVE